MTPPLEYRELTVFATTLVFDNIRVRRYFELIFSLIYIETSLQLCLYQLPFYNTDVFCVYRNDNIYWEK